MDDAAVEAVDALLADRGADGAAVTRDGAWCLARAGEEGVVVDLETAEARATFPAHRYLRPMPDATGSAFVTGTEQALEIRSLPDGDRRHSIPGTPTYHLMTGRELLAPRGEAVYRKADQGADWARYEPETGGATTTFGRVEDDEEVTCFSAAGDGSRVAVGGLKGPVSEGFLAFYDAETGALIDHDVLAYEVDRIALSPDGSDAVVCDGVGSLAGEDWRADDLDGVVVDAQFVRDGGEVVSLTYEGTLDRWDATSGDRLGTYATGEPARGLSATEDGSLVALSGGAARLVATEWSA